MLLALTTSAFFAYLLAARLTGHRGAAVVAGLVFAFSSYRRVHLPHLELQWAQWMPLAFWAWHRLLDTGRMRDGLLCAGAVLLQVLSSLYYAVFLAIGLAVVGAATLIARRGRLAGPALVGLCAGAVIAAGVAVSYAKPYAYARAKVGDRSIEETTRYSATPASFLTVSPDSVVYRAILPHEGEGETELFPGITPVVLAGAALVPPTTATAVAYGLSLVVAGDMALGTNGLTFPIARKHVSGPARAAGAGPLRHPRAADARGARGDGPGARHRALAADRPDAGRGVGVSGDGRVRQRSAAGAAAARAAAADLRLARHPAEAGHPRAADAAAARAAAARPVLHVRLDVALAAARQRLQRALLGALRRADRGAAGSARAQVDRRPHVDGRAAHPGAREAVPGAASIRRSSAPSRRTRCSTSKRCRRITSARSASTRSCQASDAS